MYILGHTTFAYILIAMVFMMNKKQLEPKTILFIFIFANIIDIIHIDIFRMLGHNLIGIFIFSGCWIWIFYKLRLLDIQIIPILLVVISTHILNDYLAGEFHFLFPFSTQSFTVVRFNSFYHLILESSYVLVFFLLFFCFKDYQKMNDYILKEKDLFLKEIKVKNIFNRRFWYFYLYLSFLTFCIGQFIIFIYFKHLSLLNLRWAAWMLLILFVSFIINIMSLGFKNHSVDNGYQKMWQIKAIK
jgi:hypothetical protein